MSDIIKIKKLEETCIDNVVVFLDSYAWEPQIFPVANNDTVYINENRPPDNNILKDLKDCEISKFNNPQLMGDMGCAIELIKNNFNPSIIWLMTYPPNSKIYFHVDSSKNRHILSLNENEKFFNYEYFYSDKKIIQENENYVNVASKLNTQLDEDNLNLELFNENFLKLKNTRIIKLEKKTVYSFGDTLHTFVNGSDKLRMILVFEIL